MLAIAEFVHELAPQAGILPEDRVTRAHCRSISGEMHQGFANLRSAMPMNLRAHYPGFRIWAGAQADIDRILSIWSGCLRAYGGPFLFGESADARRRDVRARLHAVRDLRRQAARRLRRLLRAHRSPCRRWWHGRRRPSQEHEEIEMLDTGDF